jgi:lysozyme
MNISTDGIKLIEKLEGCVLHEYKDDAGVPTIGVGHTGGVQPNQTITQAQADELLRKDLAKFVAAVNHLVKVPVNQHQFDALVIFAFNVGASALEHSTLLKKLNAKDYAGAAKEFDVWNKITDPETGHKVVSTGLANRRNAEQALFLQPMPAIPVVAKPHMPAYPNHTLQVGTADHANTKLVQAKLHITADGVFGNGTKAAVQKFQKAHALTPDSVIGKMTWTTLFK